MSFDNRTTTLPCGRALLQDLRFARREFAGAEDDLNELGVTRMTKLQQNTAARVSDLGALVKDILNDLDSAFFGHVFETRFDGAIVTRRRLMSIFGEPRLEQDEAREKKRREGYGGFGHVFRMVYLSLILYFGFYLKDAFDRRDIRVLL